MDIEYLRPVWSILYEFSLSVTLIFVISESKFVRRCTEQPGSKSDGVPLHLLV